MKKSQLERPLTCSPFQTPQMSADLKTESTAFTYDRRSFRGVSYWPSTRGLGPSAHLSCVYLSLHPCSHTPPPT